MFRFGDPGGRVYGAVGAANANLLAWWTGIVYSAGSASVSAGNGRTGGSSLRIFSTGGQAYVYKSLDAQGTWGVAAAFRFSALPAGATQVPFLAFVDTATTQVDLRLNSDGSLSATRNGTTLGATPSGLVAPNVYYHVEFKAAVHPSAGTVYVAVNGVQRLGLSGQNTRATGNSSANVLQVGPNNFFNNNTVDMDDVIVYDGQAADANGNADITGPVGDCGLAWLLPTGAGATTQFTPDTGSNYARVNEATPDGDTSYVESATVGNIDTYAMADLPAGATAVKSVASVHYARKTDVGSRGMKAELRSGGGNAAHATEIALGNSYQYYFSNWGRDPNNGTPADWTVAAVNALEAGQTVSS